MIHCKVYMYLRYNPLSRWKERFKEIRAEANHGRQLDLGSFLTPRGIEKILPGRASKKPVSGQKPGAFLGWRVRMNWKPRIGRVILLLDDCSFLVLFLGLELLVGDQ